LPDKSALAARIQEYCQQAATRIASFNEEERQQFLRLLLTKAIYFGDRLQLHGKLPIGKGTSDQECSTREPPENNGGVVTMTSKQRAHNAGAIENTTAWYRGRSPTAEIRDSYVFLIEKTIDKSQPVMSRSITGRFTGRNYSSA
jgi:hypothetical protein